MDDLFGASASKAAEAKAKSKVTFKAGTKRSGDADAKERARGARAPAKRPAPDRFDPDEQPDPTVHRWDQDSGLPVGLGLTP